MVKKHEANPLIEPKSIKPSREGYRVKGTFNAGAAEYNGEIILLLRVAEDCVAGEGSISVPYYRFDAEGGHPEILEVINLLFIPVVQANHSARRMRESAK
jgi:predicted GH43/DUF377 family glycosyl hydrolase